jgi:2-aminoadipate transaminase
MLSKLFAKRIKTQNPSRLQGLFPENNFSDNISFGGGCPDESFFPSQALQAAYQKAVDQEQAHSFQYHDVKGPGNLRDYLANRARQQGIKANADDILLTAAASKESTW